MNSWHLRGIVLVVMSVAIANGLWAQQAPEGSTSDGAPGDSSPAAAVAVSDSPAFYVNIDVDRPDRQYVEGEQLTATVTTEIDAHVYVLYQPAQGKLYQIFPNRVQSENKLMARQPTKIPGGDDLFRWQIGAPFGKERLWVIASRDPVDVLADPALQTEQFNKVSDAQMEEVLKELRAAKHDQWAASGIELETYSQKDRPAAVNGKRYGLFVGVTEYQFHEASLEAQRRAKKDDPSAPEPKGLNLFAPAEDARRMAEYFRTLGAAAETRLLTNADATRANIEQAVTQWLPKVSQPGDTVFIYFAGHGNQMAESDSDGGGQPPVNPDEPDNMEEYLLPHDYMSVAMINVLLESKDSLPPDVRARFEADVEYATQFSGAFDQTWAILRRRAITDDQMGAWLQRLSGRQVVVVLDACKSGGFAEGDAPTGDKGARRPTGFDFLDGEMVRLKGIGQDDQALLASCQPSELATELVLGSGEAFGLMTDIALDMLEKARRGAVLEDVYAHCRDRLKAEAEAAKAQGRELDQHVLMKNLCREPVVFKP